MYTSLLNYPNAMLSSNNFDSVWLHFTIIIRDSSLTLHLHFSNLLISFSINYINCFSWFCYLCFS
jgi:hypothetical protein